MLKRIAGLSFSLSFVMAIFLFTDIGDQLLSKKMVFYLFIIFGGLALVLNLISFRSGKQDSGFNLFYWIGSIVLFGGFIFKFQHWPFSNVLLIGGMLIVGLSYFLPPGILDNKTKDEDILDN
ncbi:MAG: hypothetical protein V4638_03765 [Bacteroidota bacterium]